MLKAKYQSLVEQGKLQADLAQVKAVDALQNLYDNLTPKKQNLWHSIASSVNGQKKALKGLYLWGGVGRGKTFLVDLFFENLPTGRKKRIHFHRFMHQIHQELHKLQNEKNPLKIIAKNAAKQFDLLCFDEFVVTDIGDAMILSGVLETFLAEGICFVATSNTAPESLYKNGLQRAKFLPAIALIKQHSEVLQMDQGEDFRLRALEQAKIYHFPLGLESEVLMKDGFTRMAPSSIKENASIELDGRMIKTIALADGILWVHFSSLCDAPRSSRDYIEIAKCFQTLFISSLPQLTDEKADATKRFIHMIDELYDHKVKLILSAAVSIDALYEGKRLAFEFERTKSRLHEMQSHQYLAEPHIP